MAFLDREQLRVLQAQLRSEYLNASQQQLKAALPLSPAEPETTLGAGREALCQLKPAVRKAYLAYQYAEELNGRRLEDRKAYEWLTENEIDSGKDGLGELTDSNSPILSRPSGGI